MPVDANKEAGQVITAAHINAIATEVNLLEEEHVGFIPSDFGFKTWTYDNATAGAGQLLTNGVMQMQMLILRQPATISTLHWFVQTAGSSLTNVGAGIYSAAGARLASSVNSNGATTASFQSTGLKAVTVTPQSLPVGKFYVAIWTTGTTQPQLLRVAAGGATMNAGTTLASGTGLRYALANTNLTNTAPATATQTGNGTGYWAAVS